MGHDHSHNHHHGHSHEPQQFNKAFAIATFVNLAFTFIEAGYAIYANSMSLLADAGHNLGDVLGLLLAWGASWLLTRPSNARYSYGYRRSTIIAAMANALLLVATCSIIAYESIIKLFYPSPVNEITIIVVATIGIFVNGGTALLFIRGQKDLNIKGAYLHLASDALVSLGVVVAGLIMLKTNALWLDAATGLLIVIVIMIGTWSLLRHSFALMLDAVPRNVNLAKVEAYFNNLAGVTKVHDLHIWGLSTNEIALTVHLVMPKEKLSDDQYAAIDHDLLHDFAINHVTIQVEEGSNLHPCANKNPC